MALTIRLRYVYEDVDRHGNVRLYFWRGKGHRKVRLADAPGTEAFSARYHDLLRTAATPPAASPIPARGTLKALCTKYFASATFRQLDAENTQRPRRGVLDNCLDEPIYPGAAETFGDFPVARLTTKSLRILRDRKEGLPEAANNRVRALRALFKWALADEEVAHNPARDLAMIKHATGGHHTWTLEEVEQYKARHPAGTKARRALMLLLFTGVRRSDVVLLGRQLLRDGTLAFRPFKGRRRNAEMVEIDILPELAAELAHSPTTDLAFLVTERGRPHTANGFGNWFRDRCDEAGLHHCSAHGLRKAGATLAANGGASSQQLMAIFGWKTLKEAELYTQRANRRKLAKEGMKHLAREARGGVKPNAR